MTNLLFTYCPECRWCLASLAENSVAQCIAKPAHHTRPEPYPFIGPREELGMTHPQAEAPTHPLCRGNFTNDVSGKERLNVTASVYFSRPRSRNTSVRNSPSGFGVAFLTTSILTIIAILLLPTWGWAQAPAIETFRVGFEGHVKAGYWTPAFVTISATGGFQGHLELVTPDGDSQDVVFRRRVAITGNTSETFGHFLKIGKVDFTAEARLLDETNRVVARRILQTDDPDQNVRIIVPGQPLVLHVSRQDNLFLPADVTGINIARVREASELPEQWIGYEGISAVILTTGERESIRLSPLTSGPALRTWVLQGGHLVVSVCERADEVARGELASLLPARLGGIATEDTRRLPLNQALESFARGKDPFRLPTPNFRVAILSNVRGQVLLQQGNRPMIVTAPVGLGKVTLLAFDTDVGPFRDWGATKEFWNELLHGRYGQSDNEKSKSTRLGSTGVSDLSTVMVAHLEHFQVGSFAFHWVALLVFGYLLLLGPGDYWLLRWFGRLELTWFTFPLLVLAISAGAYWYGRELKGTELLCNQVDVVDVDVNSGLARTTSLASIYSPKLAAYDLTATPQLAGSAPLTELANFQLGQNQPDLVTSWLGVPEKAVRGIGDPGSAGLLGKASYTVADQGGLEGAPFRQWSVKNFTARALAKSAPIVENNLEFVDGALAGDVTNLSSQTWQEVAIFHGDRVYSLGTLQPNDARAILGLGRSQAGFLGEQEGLEGTSRRTIQPGNPLAVDSAAVARTLLFAERAPRSFRSNLSSQYLTDLDCSPLLAAGKIVLFAKIQSAALQWQARDVAAADVKPASVNVQASHTYLRVILDPKRIAND